MVKPESAPDELARGSLCPQAGPRGTDSPRDTAPRARGMGAVGGEGLRLNMGFINLGRWGAAYLRKTCMGCMVWVRGVDPRLYLLVPALDVCPPGEAAGRTPSDSRDGRKPSVCLKPGNAKTRSPPTQANHLPA